ncbi:Ulp1 family isopeptidase [Rhizobium leguminosarum]|uniref:Ulp1 family isopeptidase n=4 Tax=Rhizobium TaxID=379 RepID=UPI001FE14EDB|nr:Ulp1 family isopeptidase [Rhizobium leguminosarum]
MYPRRNQPRDDDSREVSGWIEGVTGAFEADAWIQDYYSESREMEQDPSDLRLGSHDSDAGDRVPRRRSVGGSMRVTPQSLAPERGSGQQDVDAATEVSTKVRVGAKRGRPADRDMHPDDASRINQFAEAVRDYEILPDGSIGRGDGRVPEATVVNNLWILRGFARWLRAENRDSMASRFLNDPDSLAVDIADYWASGEDDQNRLSSALSHFRRLAPEGQELQAVGPGPRLMGRRIHDPYPDDARVIDALAKEELSKLGPVPNSQKNASNQRRFSAWLKREGKESIVSRLTGSDEQKRSLQEDFRAFTKAEGKKVVVGFDRLRQYLGAESQLKQHDPYPDDALIIDGLANEELSKLGPDSTSKRKVVQNMAINQRKFSAWLKREGRESISSRLTGSDEQQRSLKDDFRDFTKDEGKMSGVGFDRLRQYLGAESQLKQHDPYPDDTRMIDGFANEELSKLGPDSTSKRKGVLNLASNQRRFSSWLQKNGRGSIGSRLTGSDEQQQSLKKDYQDFTEAMGKKINVSLDRLRQYLGAESQLKQHHPYPDDALMIDSFAKEERSKRGSDSTSRKNASNLRKFSDWLQREGRESIVSRLTGTDEQRQSLKKDYQDFTEAMGRYTMSFKRLRQYQQAVEANAASGLSPEQAGIREPAGLDGRSDPRAEFRSTSPLQQVDPSIEGRSGLSLDHTEWLGDQHIQTDYELLMQDLQRNDPDLAARTRLIDPLIAHYHLRLGDESTALSAFQRIVNDQNGRDTADFLFLPVSDASASDPDRRGTHWSLLLVDRRNREGPAAYHYDSFRGQNNEFAAMLAQRLGTRLEPVRMTQQRNDYDCGVFVVDGTRALVRRLARRDRPAVLHLDNLVADREQLQRRLSPAPNGDRAGAAAAGPESSTQIADPAEFWHGVGQPGQLPDSWNTATFRQDLPSAAYSPVQSVNPPDAPWEQSLGASIFGTPQYMLPVEDLGGFVPASWQHGNQPVPDDLLPAMYLYDLLPSADKSTNFSIHGVPYTATLGPSGMQSDIYLFLDNLVADREQLQRRLSTAPNGARAGAAAAGPESSTQIADPAEFWHGVGQPGQLPDSWNTATFRQDLPSAAYSPVQSVNPPDAPWEQSLGASIFGTPQYMLPVDDLGEAVPPSWQHGNQPVPDDLLPAMYLYDLLPSADKPTNFSIHGVPYTATLGPSGMQSDIYLFMQ